MAAGIKRQNCLGSHRNEASKMKRLALTQAREAAGVTSGCSKAGPHHEQMQGGCFHQYHMTSGKA